MLTLVADAPTPVTPDQVWLAWNLDPVVMVVLALALWAHRRGRTVGRVTDRRRTIAFGIGLAALVVAFVSPLDALAGTLFSAHMAQHVLVLLVAAPLVAFSAPSGILLRGTPLPVRRAAVTARRAVRRPGRWLLLLGGPVGVWLLHVLTTWGWHAGVAYEAAVAQPWLHLAEHATFMVTGILFWRVVVGSRSGSSRVSGGLGVLLVFGMAMQGVFLSALLTFSREPWYPTYETARLWGLDALADQHLAGLVMWIPGSVVYMAVAMTLLVGWLRELDDDLDGNVDGPGPPRSVRPASEQARPGQPWSGRAWPFRRTSPGHRAHRPCPGPVGDRTLVARPTRGTTMTTDVLVLGGNFGGLTAALAVKHELGDDVAVTVVAADDHFLFNPSLIWLPFGKRSPADITFPVGPTFESHGVHFVHATATELRLDDQQVDTTAGTFDYDYLVIATGYRNDMGAVPGMAEHSTTITTLDDAVRAGEAWQDFLEEPGDIVIAATQGAGCFGAAYEYLFNTSYQLKKAGLKDRVGLTYVTAEPFLGHFGIGGLPHGESLLGMFLRKEGIDAVVSTPIHHVDDGEVVLDDGRVLPFAYSMIVPPFLGQELVAKAPAISDDKGYVQVRDTYQTEPYDNVYAVGIAAAVNAPWTTPVPVGIPKTGLPTEAMAHTAADNIVSQVKGEAPDAHREFGDIPAVCVMDAGNNGVLILADRMLPPRKHGVLVPGPQSHAMKLAFEKYFLWKARHGYVRLP